MNAWGFLGMAIALESAGTFLLKLSHGFEKWHWGALSIFCYSACFWVLAPAMKVLPMGVVYAIWSGVGIIVATGLGFLFFQEKLGLIQYLCITLILLGSVGLKATTAA